jgi:tRNA G37 N-methylase Trm5
MLHAFVASFFLQFQCKMSKACIDAKGDIVSVIYVRRKDAKRIKSKLENEQKIHKDYRISSSSDTIEGCVAIPIQPTNRDDEYYDEICHDEAIYGLGTQFCPYSTARLGNHHSTSEAGLNRIQTSLLRALSQFLEHHKSIVQQDQLDQQIRALNRTTCPDKLELFGDDRTLVIPRLALTSDNESLQNMIGTRSSELTHLFLDKYLWKQLAETYETHRVVRRGQVDPDSGTRQSGFQVLWSSNGISRSNWITVTEQGIRQSFDLTRVMFSRGNISEKIRFGNLVRPGEMVLDLYAGIGYFTLPALIQGKAKHVVCCEWNPDAVEALRYNLQDNGVSDRATVLVGDGRLSLEKYQLRGKFDRVSLGLLPSSEGGWRCGIAALKKMGGWLHVHGNVPASERDEWAKWLCLQLRNMAVTEQSDEWVVIVVHVEKVKSFAPTVNHYVADVFAGPPSSCPFVDVTATHGTAYVVRDGRMELCEDDSVSPPSCALSDDGALHQSWMRDVSGPFARDETKRDR